MDAERHMQPEPLERIKASELYGGEISYPSPPTEAEIEGLRGTRALKAPPRSDVNLDVPFIHQLWDTPDGFNGHWACGAVSSTMVLAYYGLLPPKPITVSQPETHTSDYGWYVCNTFSHEGHTLSSKARTRNAEVTGIYGMVLDRIGSGWGAHWHSAQGHGIAPLMAIFLPSVGNRVRIKAKPKQGSSRYLERTATEATMKACLERGHPLIVSGFFNNRLDHLIVVRGYYLDQAQGAYQWIVNDPYGFQTDRSFDGHNVVYTFEEIRPKWLAVFEGPFVPQSRAHEAVRLFDKHNNTQVGEGTLIRATDKVYVKRLERPALTDSTRDLGDYIPVRLFDKDTNEHIGDGSLVRGTDKVYIKSLTAT